MLSFFVWLVHWTNHTKSGAGGNAYNLSITYAYVKPVLFLCILQTTKQICPQSYHKDKLRPEGGRT